MMCNGKGILFTQAIEIRFDLFPVGVVFFDGVLYRLMIKVWIFLVKIFHFVRLAGAEWSKKRKNLQVLVGGFSENLNLRLSTGLECEAGFSGY